MASPDVLDSEDAPGEFTAALSTYMGRMKVLAAITRELLEDDPAETRQRNLAAAMRGVRLAREEANEHAELEELRELSAQLQADREARAAMESGVEFTRESEELPPVSGRERH